MEHERPVHYDVFLSYCQTDALLADELLQHFEDEGLKVFIPERQLLPGVSQHSVTAQLIYERYRFMFALYIHVHGPKQDKLL